MTSLPQRVIRKLRERRFAAAARAVLATPPLRAADDGVVLFSMIGTRVLLPYLVAVKSLHARLGRGRVVILDDGTLTPADKAVLAEHLGDPRIIPIAAVDTGACPPGGTWERLLTIMDLRRTDYVIQLDSDTVTLGPVEDVGEAIAHGHCFTLRGERNARIQPLAEIVAWWAEDGREGRHHVQSTIEQVMDQVCIPGRTDLHYVRGCSGFAGFAPAPSGRELAEAFSAEAIRLMGQARWAEWGSEQVTSNFVVANEPGSVLLPYDRYTNFWNTPVGPDMRFVHFIGTFRYHGGAYLRAVRQAIAQLRG
jgi:hypothetical protein